MTGVTQSDLIALCVPIPNGPKASVYMPTFPEATEGKGDEIRLGHLLKVARERLARQGMSSEVAEAMCDDAMKKVTAPTLWRHRKKSIAILMARHETRVFVGERMVAERVHVSDRFHIKPLIALRNEHPEFYVLTATENDAALYRADRENLTPLELIDLPHGAADTGRPRSDERVSQSHGVHQVGARRVTTFHGQGGAGDEAAIDRDLYYQEVGRVVREAIKRDRKMLVLLATKRAGACLEHELSKHWGGFIMVDGSPSHLSQSDILERARHAAAREVRESTDRQIEEMVNRSNNPSTITELSQVIASASAGRIGTLLVGERQPVWGRLDGASSEMVVHTKEEEGDVDLTDMACQLTLAHGGEVLVAMADSGLAELPRETIAVPRF